MRESLKVKLPGGEFFPSISIDGYRQLSCSQPQPISITCDFSAFLQYSLQYLLSCSAGQSQAGWAHIFS